MYVTSHTKKIVRVGSILGISVSLLMMFFLAVKPIKVVASQQNSVNDDTYFLSQNGKEYEKIIDCKLVSVTSVGIYIGSNLEDTLSINIGLQVFDINGNLQFENHYKSVMIGDFSYISSGIPTQVTFPQNKVMVRFYIESLAGAESVRVFQSKQSDTLDTLSFNINGRSANYMYIYYPLFSLLICTYTLTFSSRFDKQRKGELEDEK